MAGNCQVVPALSRRVDARNTQMIAKCCFCQLHMLVLFLQFFTHIDAFNPSGPTSLPTFSGKADCSGCFLPGKRRFVPKTCRVSAIGMSEAISDELRFGIGDVVYCSKGKNEWSKGTVVALHYRENDWPSDQVAPYQVRLDEEEGGTYVYIPADSPMTIRGLADGLPFTPSIPDEGNATEAFRVLEQEMSAVYRLPFVQVLEGPRPMPVAENEHQLFVPTADTGPWIVVVRLQGGAEEYNSSHRLHIKCNSAWPASPAEVRFCGSLHHPFVYVNGMLEPLVLEAAQNVIDPESSLHSLCRVLQGVRFLLTEPEVLWQDRQAVETFKLLNHERLKVIEAYRSGRRHSDLYDDARGWQREWFHPELLAALEVGTDSAMRSLVREEASGVYSIPLFTHEFCDKFVEEIDSFSASGLPAPRPNTMNNHGVIVNEIGMEPMIDLLQMQVLQPLAHVLFSGVGTFLGQHHSFVVRYKMGEDLGLDMHTDDSDVTFNVCLGKDFEGAGLQFCGNQASAEHRKASLLYFHEKGRCVVHLGVRRHGADDITEGERLNLIFWNRNPEYRKTHLHALFWTAMEGIYQRESGQPDEVCLSFTHDRDYGIFKDYTWQTEQYKGRGWCPPPFAEYAGFEPEKISFFDF